MQEQSKQTSYSQQPSGTTSSYSQQSAGTSSYPQQPPGSSLSFSQQPTETATTSYQEPSTSSGMQQGTTPGGSQVETGYPESTTVGGTSGVGGTTSGGAGTSIPLEQRLHQDQLPHMTSILVVGASGSVGHTVLKEMKQQNFDKKVNIIIGIHRVKLATDIQEWSQRAFSRTKYIDFEDPSTLDMRGIDILFIIPSNNINRIQHVRNCVEAAVKCGVKYILLISCVGAEKEETDWTRDFHQMENIVESSNLPCTFLRINWLIDNLFLQAHCIREENTIYLPIEQTCRFSPLSIADVAKATCAILLYPESHLNIAYDLTGPVALTPTQLAEDASTALGRQIRFRQVSREELLQYKVRYGFDERLARALIDYFILITSSPEYSKLGTEEFFKALTGAKGLSPAEWFRLHCDEFMEVRAKESSRDVGFREGTDEGTCAACGSNRQTTAALVNLVDAMADSFEDWFRRRLGRIGKEEQHVTHIARLRNRLKEAQKTRPIRQGQGYGREEQPQQTQTGYGERIGATTGQRTQESKYESTSRAGMGYEEPRGRYPQESQQQQGVGIQRHGSPIGTKEGRFYAGERSRAPFEEQGSGAQRHGTPVGTREGCTYESERYREPVEEKYGHGYRTRFGL